MRDEIALVERARVVVADDGARARRDAVARATTRRLILTFETTGTTTGAGSAAEGGTVIEYDDVAACERPRLPRSFARRHVVVLDHRPTLGRAPGPPRRRRRLERQNLSLLHI